MGITGLIENVKIISIFRPHSVVGTHYLPTPSRIGSVPSSVFERATMMSTLFPSPSSGGDDDRNDETDQGEEKPKLKRKKRSASFSG